MAEPTGRHSGRINKLNRLFTSRLGESVIVSIQNPIHIRAGKRMSKPKPDVSLLKPLPELFGPFIAAPDEVLLIVEISDTTERYDRKTKAPLYAEAEIPEYWILNIPEGVLVVRTEPANGMYCRIEIFKPGQVISPKLLPGVTFEVGEIID